MLSVVFNGTRHIDLAEEACPDQTSLPWLSAGPLPSDLISSSGVVTDPLHVWTCGCGLFLSVKMLDLIWNRAIAYVFALIWIPQWKSHLDFGYLVAGWWFLAYSWFKCLICDGTLSPTSSIVVGWLSTVPYFRFLEVLTYSQIMCVCVHVCE